ncbi:MAG: peptidoglycan DD-metalloendopeptidase family protein [Deltaproteobacteria bacterium]|nr:peptidoglycan DD-metalloendopeptidase family protein [Deltaproteobacteria bacterium]
MKRMPDTEIGSKRGGVWRLWVLAFVLGLVGASAGWGAVDSREAALERLQREVAGLEARLGELKDTVQGLEGRLAETELELQLQETRVLEAQAARDLAAERVTTLESRVTSLEAHLHEVRLDLRHRLRGLYRLGSFGYLRLVLSIEPGSDPLEAFRVLRFLAKRDAVTIDRFVETREELVADRAALVVEQEEVERWVLEQEKRQRELAGLRRRQAGLLRQAEAERAEVAAEAGRLAEKARKLSALVESLVVPEDLQLEGRQVQDFRGVLDWPVTGRVILGFGSVQDPRYRTEIPHNGIDIEVENPSPVRAVYPGKVLFAGPFEGYGSMVVMHHPGRVFSIYTGLQQLLVNTEDVLSLEDVVGSVDERLYFEIRLENRPQDPLEWLR